MDEPPRRLLCLPYECQLHILSFCSLSGLSATVSTCRELSKIFDDDSLWQKLFVTVWGASPEEVDGTRTAAGALDDDAHQGAGARAAFKRTLDDYCTSCHFKAHSVNTCRWLRTVDGGKGAEGGSEGDKGAEDPADDDARGSVFAAAERALAAMVSAAADAAADAPGSAAAGPAPLSASDAQRALEAQAALDALTAEAAAIGVVVPSDQGDDQGDDQGADQGDDQGDDQGATQGAAAIPAAAIPAAAIPAAPSPSLASQLSSVSVDDVSLAGAKSKGTDSARMGTAQSASASQMAAEAAGRIEIDHQVIEWNGREDQTNGNTVGVAESILPSFLWQLGDGVSCAYFEIDVLDAGMHAYIAIGWSRLDYHIHNKQPGWGQDSYGYHGDDGLAYHAGGFGRKFAEPFGSGSKVGTGLLLPKDQNEDGAIFFTLNGELIGVPFAQVRSPRRLVPSVGLHSPRERVRLRFGASPSDLLDASPPSPPSPFDFPIETLSSGGGAAIRSNPQHPLSPDVATPFLQCVRQRIFFFQRRAQADTPPQGAAARALPAGARADAAAAPVGGQRHLRLPGHRGGGEFFFDHIIFMHAFIHLRDISYLVIEEEVSNLFDHYFMHAFIHLRDISTYLVIEEASNLFDHHFMQYIYSFARHLRLPRH